MLWPQATTKQAKPLTEISLTGSKGKLDIFSGPEGQEKIEHLENKPAVNGIYDESKCKVVGLHDNNCFFLVQYFNKVQ